MCAFTASRSEKSRACLLEALVDICLEYLVGKLREGFPPLLARKWMNGDSHQC